ncbi:MAG: hypothetical protein ACREE6_19000, partial [Limisphaerales bacterium]
MKQKRTLMALAALCILLWSCSPRRISGQIFITEAGVNYALGGVQIEVISAKDANDFLTQCQSEIGAKTRALKTAYMHAKTTYDAAARTASDTPTAAIKAALAKARIKLNVAAAALRNFPSPNDYFAGFLPSPIETTVTGAEGDFMIDRPKEPAKVFAKAQRQLSGSVENYYWLVAVPFA